ncbi:type II toxin-antitoxin system RelE/ParE family toxin [Phosphitispora fastidiosa]|uniref:type II toxin-antitoxin system RelE/ParE family toxin n=1 Tax=Phosphitispora fastidiosa TaxID=2837202 RepID=UPI001E2FC6E2|nr:type II toxin-antitoxin system RelE/ParE family toxin [Phosphitispora fastidiosa]MBU7007691.1 plasmid stabilization system protein ParE [Phosphitispora fastidiosa]
MAYKLVISKEAHKDIDDIVHYIAVELANPTAAASFLDDVEKSYIEVVNNPRMYSRCQDARLGREGYRKIVIKNYLVLYRIDDEAKKVFIVRIIYGGRNYPEFI